MNQRPTLEDIKQSDAFKKYSFFAAINISNKIIDKQYLFYAAHAYAKAFSIYPERSYREQFSHALAMSYLSF